MISKFTKLQANSYVLSACIVAIFAVLIACPMPPNPNPAPRDTTAPTPVTELPAGFEVPSGSTFLPAQNADSIDPNSTQLTIVFNEAIWAVEAATARISLVASSPVNVLGNSDVSGAQSTSTSTLQTFDVNNTSQVSIAGAGLTLISVSLSPGTNYSVNIPTGVLTDAANNPVVQTIAFRTADNDPPTQNGISLAFDNNISANNTIVTVTFNENIALAASPSITLASGTVGSTTDISTQPTISAVTSETNAVVVTIQDNLDNGNYVLTFANGTISDTVTPTANTATINAEFVLSGPRISDTDFTINVDSTVPSTEITVEFSENIANPITGVTILDSTGVELTATTSVGSSEDADKLTITVNEALANGIYVLSIAEDAITGIITLTEEFSLAVPIITNNSGVVSVVQGRTIASIIFASTGGVIDSCSATGLPTGLSVAEVGGECVVSGTVAYSVDPGTPTATITATNTVGSDSATINFTISLGAPIIPNHDPTVTVAQGDAILPISFASTGGVIDSCSATGLPTGLSVAEVGGKCVVSGTVAYSVTPGDSTATITATNTADSDNASITFEVVAAASATLNAPTAPSPVTAGLTTALPDLSFMGSNLAASTCTITSTLPAGLALTVDQNGQNCVVSGSVESTLGAGPYTVTVTAENEAGTPASAAVTLSVVAPATLTPPANPSPVTAGTINNFDLTFTGIHVEAGSCEITSAHVNGLNLTLSEGNGNCVVTVSTTTSIVEDVYTIEVTATNEAGTPASAVVTLSVVAPATLTAPAAPDRFSAGTNPPNLIFTGTNVAMCKITSTHVDGLTLMVSRNGDGNCVVTVTTTAVLLHPFPKITVTAENSAGTPVSTTVILNVALASTLESPLPAVSTTVFSAGAMSTIPDLIFNGSNVQSCEITSGGGVTGLTVEVRRTGQGCVLSGSIVSTVVAGNYPVEVTAMNALGETPVSARVAIEVVAAPTLTPPAMAAPSFTERVSDIEFELIFTGTNLDSCTITSGMRSGFSVDTPTINGSGNCVVVGRTTAFLRANAGNYDLTVTATNSVGGEVSATVTLMVVASARLGRAPAQTNVTAGENVPPITIPGSNIESCSITSDPVVGLNLSVVRNGDGNCEVSGITTTSLTAGRYAVTVSAANSLGTSVLATKNIVIRVVALATLTVPTVPNDIASGVANQRILLTFNGTNVRARSCTITSTLPTGLIPIGSGISENGGNCTLRLRTTAALSAGMYPVTVTVENLLGDEVSATVTITVN